MTDELDRLQDVQDDMHAARGVWGANDLADACADAAVVPSFGGDADALQAIAESCEAVALTVEQALDLAEPLRKSRISAVWTGATHVGANQALAALTDDMYRAMTAFRTIGIQVRLHAEHVRTARADGMNARSLAHLADTVGSMAWGVVPTVELREQHTQATAHVDARVTMHIAMRNAAEDFATALHEIEAQARTGRLSDSPLSAVDEVVIAGAGWTRTNAPHPPVLTAAMDQRAADALTALNEADRERMTGLLAAALSAEHRAYLMKALAAGYRVEEVARFDQLLAGHGDDPEWLEEHLSPLALDPEAPEPGSCPVDFDGAEWQQGAYPTCVASSTVTARAQVDPLYALQLTTGGHPGDPDFDNTTGFAARLRDEQVRVYDDGRNWRQRLFHTDGMNDEQSATIANEEIAPHTGVHYEDVRTDDRTARENVLPEIERAVDEGQPVPLSVDEDREGHQLMVIGHSGDRLQIYNPWGYTYWVTEQEFTSGRVDGVDPEVPREPTSVRLPQAVGR